METPDQTQPVCLPIERSDVHECVEVLTILCEDLEAELKDRYSSTIGSNSGQRRFNNDMEPVARGRAVVEKLASRER